MGFPYPVDVPGKPCPKCGGTSWYICDVVSRSFGARLLGDGRVAVNYDHSEMIWDGCSDIGAESEIGGAP